jgi:hypothetical protein
MAFDGDAAFAFQIHAVQDLLFHVLEGHRMGDFQQAVGRVDLPWSMCAMMEKLRMRSMPRDIVCFSKS